MMNRRNFFGKLLQGAAALSVPLAAAQILSPKKLLADKLEGAQQTAAKKHPRWVFLVDAEKCTGCGFCVKACKEENEVPLDANVTRTWIERYVLTKDNRLLADTRKPFHEGFTDMKIDLGRGETQEVKAEDIRKAFFVPKLCNQCENPPCVQVCPVGATYQTADGVTLVDRNWCIGCGYCVMGCPYGVRFFHPEKHVVDKCNFCYHRITKGLLPACVQACPFGARRIGNINDPNDPVTKVIMTERVSVLKEEFGTKPQVYYLNMSKEVR